MNGTGVARRYAKAMIDLATRDGTLEATGDQLQLHRGAFSGHASLQSMLQNPSFDIEAKTEVVTAVLDRTQPSGLVRNFLLLLLKNNRLHHLGLICDHYERMANDKLGRLKAQVISAVELDPDQVQALEQKVSAATQQDVQLETQLDPSILGGVIVRIDHTVLDGSLRGRLERLRRELAGNS